MGFPALGNEQLWLRALQVEDVAEIYALRTDPEVNRYIPRPPMTDVDQAKRFIRKIHHSIEVGDWLYWAITQQGSDRLVGTVCLWQFQWQHARAEIGYELLPKFQRQGIMTAAARLVLDFAFQILHLHSVEARTVPENLRSTRLLERLGFGLEGHFSERLHFEGHFWDEAVYAMRSGS